MSKSTLKDLERLESRVKERLGELQPVLEEWGELTQVAGKLGIEVPSLNGTGTAGKAKTVRRAKPKRRPRTDYAPKLELAIKEHPGTAPSRLAEMVGDVRKSSTYRIIRRWEVDGTVDKRDNGIFWTA